jgi:hypothetical protein
MLIGSAVVAVDGLGKRENYICIGEGGVDGCEGSRRRIYNGPGKDIIYIYIYI